MMNADQIEAQIIAAQNIALAGLKSGQEIGRMEAQAEIKRLRADRLALALRLYGEDPLTFSPESAEVMDRMRPLIEALLNGEAQCD